MSGRAGGVAGREASEGPGLGGKLLTDDVLDEGQEPQADREQANQAGDVVIAVEEERGEGERLAFQAAEAPAIRWASREARTACSRPTVAGALVA